MVLLALNQQKWLRKSLRPCLPSYCAAIPPFLRMLMRMRMRMLMLMLMRVLMLMLMLMR